MKKKSGSRIARVLSQIVNIRYWFDWDRVKSFTVYLVSGIKQLFIPQKTTDTESFNAAAKRLNLSDADLLVKQKALLRLSILMLFIASLVFIYAGYHLFYGTFKATFVSLVVVLVALVLAFRYHFWYFQIKNRLLGCTLGQWYRQGLLGEKK